MSPIVNSARRWLRKHPVIASCLVVLAFFVKDLPGWLASVWALHSAKPLQQSITEKMNNFQLPHFSVYWITSAIGWSVLLGIFFLLITGRRSEAQSDRESASGGQLIAPQERETLLSEAKTANEKYLEIETAHNSCETVITNLKSKVTRLQEQNETQGIQIHVRDGDIKGLKDASKNLQASFEEERFAHRGQLATAKARIEERDADLVKAKDQLKSLSPLEIICSTEEPYRRVFPHGGKQRVAFYIGVRSSVPIKDLIVEIDVYNPQNPAIHQAPYQLHEETDEKPFKRSVAINDETDEKLFLVATVIEDVRKTMDSNTMITVHTNQGDFERFPGVWTVIARASNAVPCKRSLGFEILKFGHAQLRGLPPLH
jgi:hypothetical protein